VATSIDETINVDPYIKNKMNQQQSVFDQFAGLKAVTPDYEKKMMNKALNDAGSIAAASRLLNMSRTTFRDRMKKYQIDFEKLT
jgi:DNA-binding NtrC family response regulator